jgi:hypothetical protein
VTIINLVKVSADDVLAKLNAWCHFFKIMHDYSYMCFLNSLCFVFYCALGQDQSEAAAFGAAKRLRLIVHQHQTLLHRACRLFRLLLRCPMPAANRRCDWKRIWWLNACASC